MLEMLGLLAPGLRLEKHVPVGRPALAPVSPSAIRVLGTGIALMQGNGDLGGKAGIGHQQATIGPEALPSRGCADRLEEERRERLPGDPLASGLLQGRLDRGLP